MTMVGEISVDGRVKIYISPVERSFLIVLNSGFGMSCPVFFDTRTFDPSSRYLLDILVGSLHIDKIWLLSKRTLNDEL